MTSLEEARVALLRTDPICRDLSFDNFTTVLLEFKTVFHMTGNLGRVRRNVVLMATGNKQVGDCRLVIGMGRRLDILNTKITPIALEELYRMKTLVTVSPAREPWATQ